MKKLDKVVSGALIATKTIGDFGKAVAAFFAGATLFANIRAKNIKSTASKIGSFVQNKNSKDSEEGITLKKSTFVAVLVALAAVAAALGALYVYVLRREKELDEYEQLLFSEDFDDDYDMDYSTIDSSDEDVAETKETIVPEA